MCYCALLDFRDAPNFMSTQMLSIEETFGAIFVNIQLFSLSLSNQ